MVSPAGVQHMPSPVVRRENLLTPVFARSLGSLHRSIVVTRQLEPAIDFHSGEDRLDLETKSFRDLYDPPQARMCVFCRFIPLQLLLLDTKSLGELFLA